MWSNVLHMQRNSYETMPPFSLLSVVVVTLARHATTGWSKKVIPARSIELLLDHFRCKLFSQNSLSDTVSDRNTDAFSVQCISLDRGRGNQTRVLRSRCPMLTPNGRATHRERFWQPTRGRPPMTLTRRLGPPKLRPLTGCLVNIGRS